MKSKSSDTYFGKKRSVKDAIGKLKAHDTDEWETWVKVEHGARRLKKLVNRIKTAVQSRKTGKRIENLLNFRLPGAPARTNLHIILNFHG